VKIRQLAASFSGFDERRDWPNNDRAKQPLFERAKIALYSFGLSNYRSIFAHHFFNQQNDS